MVEIPKEESMLISGGNVMGPMLHPSLISSEVREFFCNFWNGLAQGFNDGAVKGTK